VHVAGHQDDTIAYANLGGMAQLNVQVDQMAKTHIKRARCLPCYFSCSLGPLAMWYNNTKLQDISVIYEIIHTQQVVQYWQSREKTEPNLLEHVDWPAIGRALPEVPCSQQFFLSKYTLGMCRVGK